MSVMRPDLIMKSVIPVVMAGIIAIYGLVVSVLIANKRESQFLQKRCGSSRTIFVISFRPIVFLPAFFDECIIANLKRKFQGRSHAENYSGKSFRVSIGMWNF